MQPLPPVPSDRGTLEALYRGALAVTEGLDIEQALSHIVEAAQEITHAKYAACGVPGDEGMLHFIYRGVTAAVATRIGAPPEGKGLLGAMRHAAHLVRIDALDEHPDAHGFPPHHPAMKTFLGAPIIHRGRNIGVIYLTEKDSGTPFTEDDERAVELLARFAATALSNAHQHLQVNEELERRSREIDETNQTLHALSERVLWMLEGERRLLAQELHDDLGQILSAAVLAADHIAAGRVNAAEAGPELRTMLRSAVDDVRRISHGLRPSMLDELGPVPAIRAMVNQLDTERRGWIAFSVQGSPQRLPEPVETVLFRVAQEGLTNAVRHSGAAHIDITVTFRMQAVRLVVADNGIGMPPQISGPGLGIAGMRERAVLVEGSFQIASKPGQGVEIRLEVPV